jgi:two-component system alkaline phosphatase synthesis response regulator PhoP
MIESQKILVVDDNRALLLAAQRVLEKAGYQVVTASNGVDALKKAGDEKPQLIILDIIMPQMNGYEVCRRLKSEPDTEKIPVIMLSVKGEIDESKRASNIGLNEVNQGYDSGANNFLTKPVSAVDLLNAVSAELSFTDYLSSRKSEARS